MSIIEEDRDKLSEDFNLILEAVESGEADNPEYLDEVFKAEGNIEEELDDLVFDAETGLRMDLQKVSDDNQRSVIIGLVGLIIFPLLAVWTFLITSQLTQPLLNLTNAVIAAGGGHYRIELLDEVLKRRDGLGKLAQAVDEMTTTTIAREEDLEKEVEELRAQLHEARRRKLVLTSTIRQEEGGAEQ